MATHSSIIAWRIPWTEEPDEVLWGQWGQEEAREKGVETHSSIIAWRIPLTEEPGRLCPWRFKESDTTE